MPSFAELRVWLGELAATPWLVVFVGFLALLRPAVKVLAGAARDVRDLWNVFATPEKRRRAAARRAAAEYLRNDLVALNAADAWDDVHYAELEAEIEAEGRRFWGWLFYRRAGLRRERSLSLALRNSSEKRIILLGDPGSGKSVALRHIALQSAAAARSRVRRRALPLYVNLRTLRRASDRKIDASLIREHVLATINRRENEHLRAFLDEQFDTGITSGEWLFLFDSFDEIPDILSATDSDAVIREYSDAIADFLSPFNRCRAILASREFRAPQTLPWPRFRVLPLTDQRRRQLIHRSVADPDVRNRVLANLHHSTSEIERISRNPLFLRLLCEYVARERDFPDQLHRVLHAFVEARLEKDRTRIWERHAVVAATLRTAAEEVAAHMLIAGLGLEVDLDVLVEQIDPLRIEAPVDACLQALELTGLARFDRTGPKPLFSFAHRRFQEYFATQYVMRNAGVVDVEQLLTDGRWRETAVVLLQTSSRDELTKLLRGLNELTDTAFRAAPPPESWAARQSYRFAWPPAAIHVLSLLQEGLARRGNILTHAVREEGICKLLRDAWNNGGILDRKWALEVAGVAPHHTLHMLLLWAFASKSKVLANAAYRQVARLEHLPADIARQIRAALMMAFAHGTLRRDRDTTAAFLARVPNSENLVHAMKFLLALRWIDAVLHLAGLALVLTHRFWADRFLFPRWQLILTCVLIGSFVTLPWIAAIGRRIIPVVFGVAFRIAALVAIFLVGWEVPAALHLSWVVGGLLMWPVFAILGIRVGEFMRPALRPLIFLFPLPLIGRIVRDLTAELHRQFFPPYLCVHRGAPPRLRRKAWTRLRRKRWRENVGPLLVIAAVIALLIVVLWPASDRSTTENTNVAAEPEFHWERLVVMVSIAALVLLTVTIIDAFRTWRIVRRIEAGRTVTNLTTDLRAVLLNSSRSRIARAYRLRNALAPTSAAAAELMSLCAEVEKHGLRARVIPPKSLPDMLRYAIASIRYTTNAALIDELVLLTEAVRARRGAVSS